MRLVEKILTTLVGACIVLSLTGACHRKNAEAEIIAAVKIENADSYMLNEILQQQNRENEILNDVHIIKKAEAIDGLKVNYRQHFNISGKDREIMYRIVEAEAGGENINGRMLVANVILNRCLNDSFPDTVKDVVFEKSQFSPVSDGRYYSVNVSKTTKKAVDKAVSGIDNSSGAVYFMCRRLADNSNVCWFDNSLDYLFKYGCHEFYKD